MNKEALIAAVREHAQKHYEEGGWDYVVECYEDADILEEIGDARTPAQAIANVKRIVNLRDERRREVESTAF